MVNTRKKSYIPPVNESGEPTDAQNPGYQSDSSTSSTTRRLTRRSIASVQSQAPLTAVATPTRRSRRLSNSSVESVSIAQAVATPLRRTRRMSNSSIESVHIDTPNPAARTSRRTSRTRGAASESDAEDVEVTKKRKLIENADTLGAISEEKTEIESITLDTTQEDTTQEEELEIVYEKSVLAKKIEEPAKPETSPEDKEIQMIDKLAFQIYEESDCVIEEMDLRISDDGDEFATPEAEEINTITKETEAKSPGAKTATKPSQPIIESAQPQVEKDSAAVAEDILTESSSSVEPAKQKEDIKSQAVDEKASESKENVEAPTKVVKKTDKKALTINERLAKMAEGKAPVVAEKPKEIKEKPAKPLPCGADVMKNIPRGMPKSGRVWKDLKTNPRYLYKDKGLKMPFEKITQLRTERKRIKDLENRLKEEERARRAEISRRREINKKREEENARRGEVVQVIRNSNKIKRMNKKQLKLIQKRDTTTV